MNPTMIINYCYFFFFFKINNNFNVYLVKDSMLIWCIRLQCERNFFYILKYDLCDRLWFPHIVSKTFYPLQEILYVKTTNLFYGRMWDFFLLLNFFFKTPGKKKKNNHVVTLAICPALNRKFIYFNFMTLIYKFQTSWCLSIRNLYESNLS